MIKKICAYQRLIYQSGLQEQWRGWIIGCILMIFPLTFATARTCFELSGLQYLIMSCLALPLILAESHTTRLLRAVPVSDRFAVANLIFILPLSITVVVLGISIALIAGLEALIGEMELHSVFAVSKLTGALFDVLLFAGFWFLLCGSAFHRGRWTKIIWRTAIAALFFVVIFGLSHLVGRMGYHGNYMLSDLPELLPDLPLLPCAAVFAAAGGVFAWFHCLKYYRADVNGQRSAHPTKKGEGLEAQQTLDSKYQWAVLGIFLVVLAGFGVLIRFIFTDLNTDDQTQEYHFVTAGPADYAAWDSYGAEAGMPEDLQDSLYNGALLLFPKKVDPDTVTEYCALAEGDWSENWISMDQSYRFLSVTLPVEAYQAEKARVSALSLTYLGQTNAALHDTDHFAAEAYLAIYAHDWEEYEYALFEDETCRIAYVYCYDCDPGSIPTAQNIGTNRLSSVVSVRESNYAGRGYAIYNFWNEEENRYEWWYPGYGE